MSFNDLFAEYYSVLEALRRCADRLRFMLDIIFPHCVLHVIDHKSIYSLDTHIMAEAFHEYHCHKLLEEFRLECNLLQQLTLVEGIRRLFVLRKIVNSDDIKYHDKREPIDCVNIYTCMKPKIRIHTSRYTYMVQVREEMWDEFDKLYSKLCLMVDDLHKY